MTITVNGNKYETVLGSTLKELINSLNYDIRLIAVEYNCTIPAKSDYDTIVLKDGDIIEIVMFMGGG